MSYGYNGSGASWYVDDVGPDTAEEHSSWDGNDGKNALGLSQGSLRCPLQRRDAPSSIFSEAGGGVAAARKRVRGGVV